MRLPLPTIASRVLTFSGMTFAKTKGKVERMMLDPLCSNQLLAGVLSSDPLLTARILSRSNAAMPANADGGILRPTDAVTQLGLAVIQGLLLETRAIPNDLQRPLAACWGLANATAAMCRILVTFCRASVREVCDDEEILHVCGLLHDLGSIVAIDRFNDLYRMSATHCEQDDIPFERALQKHLGIGSGGLGMLTATSWAMPPLLAQCMRYHPSPTRARENVEHICIVHVARNLVRACGFTTLGNDYVDEIDPLAMDTLGLRITDLEGATRSFFEEMDDLEVYEGVLAPT